MKKLFKSLYNQNYIFKVILIILIAITFSFLAPNVIDMVATNSIEYHSTVLTINSILSGFALTNLGVLISISDDQLVRKLEGTDILMRRNVAISHSVIFGTVSIFCALVFVLNINYSELFIFLKRTEIKNILKILFNYVELIALILSIVYFIISVKLMIKLLSYIYVPKKRITCEVEKKIREQMENSTTHLE